MHWNGEEFLGIEGPIMEEKGYPAFFAIALAEDAVALYREEDGALCIYMASTETSFGLTGMHPLIMCFQNLF